MLTAGEFCKCRVAVTNKDESLGDAARRMRDEHVGSLVVVEEFDGKRMPVGMLTDRDIVIGAVAADRRDLAELRVADVVLGDLIKAQEADELRDTLKRMKSYGIRRIPVVDRDGMLAGIIAFDDLIVYLSEQLYDLATLLDREQSLERELAD